MTETPEATGVTVSGDGVANGALSLKKGTTAQLTAKVAPDDADQAVTWASSDDKVVTVDKTGKVTAVAKGRGEGDRDHGERQVRLCDRHRHRGL